MILIAGEEDSKVSIGGRGLWWWSKEWYSKSLGGLVAAGWGKRRMKSERPLLSDQQRRMFNRRNLLGLKGVRIY